MTANLMLGLDIGTLAVKGALINCQGVVVAEASVEREPVHPHSGWVEMDAERDWWGAGVTVIRKLLSENEVTSDGIAVVGVSALVPCLCLLDRLGFPLRPAILYSDNRALAELSWVNEVTGLSLNAQAVIPKLLWIKNHEPNVYGKAKHIVSTQNYFVYRLTDVLCMDYDTASIMGGAFNADKLEWDFAFCEQVGIPSEIWPMPSPATRIVGSVTKAAALATGLKEGTSVIAGTGDTFPTIVGCGAIDPGDAMLSFGTTGLLTVTNLPLETSARGPHFSSNQGGAAVEWGANVLSAGRLVRWFVDNFAGSERMVASRMGVNEFDLIEAEAKKIPAGSDGLVVLPHWLGRRTPEPDATIRGAMLGLTPLHTVPHIYRALLESFLYNVRQDFEKYRANIKRLVVTAGGARSPLWRQIAADVLDFPLEYNSKASGAMGIAFLAGYGAGLVNDFSTIKGEWLIEPERIIPDEISVEVYNQYYPIYCQFDALVSEPFRKLASLGKLEE